jgi:hypothetical protein
VLELPRKIDCPERNGNDERLYVGRPRGTAPACEALLVVTPSNSAVINAYAIPSYLTGDAVAAASHTTVLVQR